jgi:beta-carotene ketolase (CrtW type)
LSLAAALIGGWIAVHVCGVYGYRWTAASLVHAPIMVALQTWLSVGLFIVAHDAMHGSLAPGRPGLNTAIGTLCLGLYAGFRFDRLKASHMRHHQKPGTDLDPDFHAAAPHAFGPWFASFVRTYFGWREFGILTVYVGVSLVLLHAEIANLLVFWALPASLSAVQLFFFGTWLPHRHEDTAFADCHNARTSHYPSVISLLTCFHFGRHHEHHLCPWLPWWRLDAAYRTGRRSVGNRS